MNCRFPAQIESFFDGQVRTFSPLHGRQRPAHFLTPEKFQAKTSKKGILTLSAN
jgi:hypothetical protein